jgi:diadenosine tetraphosphate (Ap4A) HIT family hydrolase
MTAFPDCKGCGFRLWNPIAELTHTYVGLYDDGRFPGRCIISLKEHQEHLHTLSVSTLSFFMKEVQQLGEAVMKVTGAPRINYAILGNAVPHIHAHVFPRQFPEDRVPNSSPWSHPAKVWALKPERKVKIIEDLRKALGG